MFSTRTILRNRDPWWEEEAFSENRVGGTWLELTM